MNASARAESYRGHAPNSRRHGSPRVVEPNGAKALAVRVPPVAVVEANRRLAVILAADIVGYSRLMALDEDGTVQTLATYQEVIAALVAEHQGRIFNLAGDGIMAEFASAVQAVRCAVAIQRMAARRNGDLAEDRQVVFRIGLNLGDVVARGDDLLGDGVNVAARLQALAEPEQICISAAVREQIADKVAFGCASRGEHSLKHIARPVHVYAVDWALQAPVPVAELRKGALPLPGPAVDRRAAVRQHEPGCGSGVLCRWADRGPDSRRWRGIAGSSSSPATRASPTRGARYRSSRSGASSASATWSRAARGARATGCASRPSWSRRKPAIISGPTITIASSRICSRCRTRSSGGWSGRSSPA